MSTVHEDQLTILAQNLVAVKNQIAILKEQEDTILSEAFKLLKKARLKKHPTIYGCFTRCKGRTTKEYTNEDYLNLKQALDEAKALADVRKEYNEKRGDDYLKFTTNNA
jgi:hypothetical protein